MLKKKYQQIKLIEPAIRSFKSRNEFTRCVEQDGWYSYCFKEIGQQMNFILL